jgi:hypothetical protein
MKLRLLKILAAKKAVRKEGALVMLAVMEILRLLSTNVLVVNGGILLLEIPLLRFPMTVTW